MLSAFPSENPLDLVCVSLKYFRAITSLTALLSNDNLLYFLEDLFIYKIIVEKEKRTFFVISRILQNSYLHIKMETML